MYQSRDPNALEICPYNNAHSIIKSRMSTHLVKCRRVHEGESAMTVCLFNANHNIPETEYQYHVENCPDRINLDKHILVSKDVNFSRFPVENVEVEDQESWDTENCQSYNPDDYCEKNVILRQKKVESASTRRNFRNEERQRIQKLRDMGPSDTDSKAFKPSEGSSQNKFRSTSLANTTTNISENYTYEDIQRLMKSSAPKAIFTDPNCKPLFIRSNDETEKQPFKNNSTPDTEESDEAGACAIGFSSAPDSDNVKREDGQGFIVQKPKRKIGRGRGRGVTR